MKEKKKEKNSLAEGIKAVMTTPKGLAEGIKGVMTTPKGLKKMMKIRGIMSTDGNSCHDSELDFFEIIESEKAIQANQVEIAASILAESERFLEHKGEHETYQTVGDHFGWFIPVIMGYARSKAQSPESYRAIVADFLEKLATKIKNPNHRKAQLQKVGSCLISWISERGDYPSSRKKFREFMKNLGHEIPEKTLSAQLLIFELDQICRDNKKG